VASERGDLLHTYNSCDHHDEDQRHDDHLQQIDIACADNVGPMQRIRNRLRIASVDYLQREAEDDTGHQPGKHLSRQ
jgi:hypothetical protein